MQKTTFTLLFFLVSIAFAGAQSCLPEGIVLYYQQNVDNFSAAYPNCTTIQGDVEITGDFITNLNGLSNIVSIGGNLKIISATNLSNLDGLNNLTHVGGNLIIQYNPNLSSLSALSKLNSIGGDLFFYANKLTSLSGLDNLVTVGGKLELQSTNVINLNGLQNLTSIGTDLVLWYNSAMTSISGLNKLDAVGKDIRIETNTKLAGVSGFNALKTVGGNLIVQQSPLNSFTGMGNLTKVGGVCGIRGAPADLFLGNLDSVLTRLEIGTQAKNLAAYPKLRYTGSSLVISGNNLTSLAGMPLLRKITGLVLQNNPLLNSLTGLENVDTLAGVITISNNNSLTSLQGLHNARVYLPDINVFTSFFIENNPALSDCAIDLLCRNLILTNHLQVWNNAPGCANLNDLYDNCSYPAEAKVLIDKNTNCLPDTADTPAAGVQARLANAPRISLRETDSNGIASLARRGIFNFSIDLPHFPNKNWAVCQDSVLIDTPNFTDTTRQTFLLQALTQCPDLGLRLGLPSTFPDCSKTSAVTVAVTNQGTVTAQTTRAAVVMPAGLQLVNAVPPVSTQQGDTLFFNLGDMAPFATTTVNLTVKTACSGLKNGQALCVEAFGLLANACPPAQPNFSEIHISSECVGNATVRFTLKNTGNAPTQGPHEYVVLRNKLRLKPVSFSLAPQETLVVDLPATGATFRMEATKWDDGTITARSHENCGGFTAGWVTAIWQDEGPAGRDFGCRQFGAAPAGVVKSAIPSGAGIEKKVTPGRPIEYTIDFQNQRADTVNRVLLRDFLSPQLNINGFLPVAASHPFTWEIRGDNMLEVVFTGAELPPGGKGFFSFSLPQQPNLPDGTFVYNNATVSFEYGVPVATNTVEQTISELPGVGHACLPQGIQFTTQAEINNFPKDYEGCATILGNVDITGPNLSNLNGLIQLQHIEGNLVFYNLNQSNLAGLDSLRTVGGSISVYNSSINSMTGLNRLDSVGDAVSIWYNPKIKNMSGLNRLSYVGGNFSLRENPLLQDLNFLQNLKTTGAGLEVLGHPALFSLNGLNGLQSTGNAPLNLTANYPLNNLSGLENLTNTGGLSVYLNQGLTDLTALANLDIVGGAVILEANPLLESLAGLGKFDTIAGDVTIRANALLADFTGLEHVTAIDGNVLIEENPVLNSLNGLNNLSAIRGNLTINKQPLVASLSPLENLYELGGLELRENTGLTNLEGLEDIPDTLSTLVLQNLEEMSTLIALNHLTTVTGNLLLGGMFILPNLNGLENVAHVGGSLGVSGLVAMSNLSGLGPVTHVGGDLGIGGNTQLVSLSEFRHLTSIGGRLYLELNPALTHLGGLGSLKNIGGSVIIDANEALTGLDSLTSLESIGGELQISGNQNLSDCSIFAVCGHLLFSPNTAFVMDNAPGCNNEMEIEMNCQVLPVLARVLLDNNGDCLPDAGDLPVGDIQIKLNGAVRRATRPSDGMGFARFEYLRDGTFTLDLPGFPSKNWDVCLEPVVVSTANASDTIRATLVLSPVYQCPDLSVQLHLPSQFRGCFAESEIQIATQNTGTVTAESVRTAVVMPPAFELLSAVPAPIGQSGDTLYFNLGDIAALDKKPVKLIVHTRCDFFVFGHTLCWEAFATAQNGCPVTLPAFSEIKLSAECLADTVVRFSIKNIGDAPTQSPHEYQILRNAEPFEADIFSLKNQDSLTVDVPADGSTWRMEATKFDNGARTAFALENCGGLTPGQVNSFWLDRGAPNHDFGCREVIGAYDPNQKTAAPTGAGPERLLEANIPLQYTIDFQNTGTDTAFRVLLLDVLPAGLDVATFRPAASSHPCVWEIRGADSLEVLFFPIALPDSNVNEPGSRGFFSFEINQLPDLPTGSLLENTASIIFDFNPPIVTNTVQHRIGRLMVRVDEPQPNRILWRVLGNPTRDAATFEATESIGGDKLFELFDAAGRPVRNAQFAGQSFEFRRNALSAGVYFFRISDEQGRWFTGKIVVVD